LFLPPMDGFGVPHIDLGCRWALLSVSGASSRQNMRGTSSRRRARQRLSTPGLSALQNFIISFGLCLFWRAFARERTLLRILLRCYPACSTCLPACHSAARRCGGAPALKEQRTHAHNARTA